MPLQSIEAEANFSGKASKEQKAFQLRFIAACIGPAKGLRAGVWIGAES